MTHILSHTKYLFLKVQRLLRGLIIWKIGHQHVFLDIA
jgi:hypothetical protein